MNVRVSHGIKVNNFKKFPPPFVPSFLPAATGSTGFFSLDLTMSYLTSYLVTCRLLHVRN